MAAFSEKVEADGMMPSAEAAPQDAAATVRVWDPVVRVFHWSLVVAFVVAWATGDEARDIHEITGYVIAGLLAVRLVWGVVGTTHARFTDFVHRPSTVVSLPGRYRPPQGRPPPRPQPGRRRDGDRPDPDDRDDLHDRHHDDDGRLLGRGLGADAHELAVNLTIVLIGLHLVGVFVASAEHRENLVKAMITGRKRR